MIVPESLSWSSERGRGERRELHYLGAALITGAVFGLRFALSDYVAAPFIFFYPAVLLIGLASGLGPGLLATGLSAALAARWFVQLDPGANQWHLRQFLTLSLYLAMGILMSMVAERFRQMSAHLAAQEREKTQAEMAAKADASEASARRSSAAAQLSAAKLGAVFHAVADGITVFDAQGNVTLLNEAQARINGAQSGSSFPEKLSDFSAIFVLREPSGRVLPVSEWPVSRVLRGERLKDLELWAQRTDTGQRWYYAFSGVPLYDERGLSEAVVVTRDLTERKRFEDALRESEQRYAAIFAHAPFAIAVNRLPENTLEDVNDAFLELFELDRNTALGKSSIELGINTPEQRAEIGARLARDGSVRDLEITRTNHHGTPKVLSLSIDTVSFGDRRAVVSTLQDITARKVAEDHLSAERRRLAVTLQSIGDAVIATDVARNVVLMNPVAEALTGWSAKDAIGQPLDTVYRLAEGISGTRGDAVELVAKDGTTRHVSQSAASMHDGSGQASGVVLVFRDQTRERDQRLALLQSEARYRAIFEQIGVGAGLVDLTTTRYLQANTRLAEILGTTTEDLERSTWTEFTHPDDLETNQRGVRQMLATGTPYHDEKRYIRRDGKTVWTKITVSPVDLNSTRPVVIALIEDITEQRSVAAQLHQAQKLESVGRLAGGVAHDFNNLLTVILATVEVMRDDAARGEQLNLEDLDQIGFAGQRARDLTRQLLAFARRQIVTPASLELSEVVSGCLKMLGRLLGEDLELRTRLDAHGWKIFADPGQVEQVVMNLTVNARDAMPRGGTIDLETSNHAGPVAGQDGEWVCLKVRDSGHGMTPEVKAHLFEPFFTTKELGKGTGLGLATVHGIVTRAGGQIVVESEPGAGATFEVYWPRRDDARTVVEAPKVGLPTAGTERLLVVEDDPQVRAVIVRTLSEAGYQVVATPRGEAALDLPDEQVRQVRLLLTDVVMPGLDGRAIAEALHERHPALRVLYVSGYTRDAIAERGVVDEGLQFLAKPFTRAALLAKVREVLDATT